MQLRHLWKKGYRSVTFDELVAERPAGRVVAITFDDGYRSVLDHGLPILESFAMHATVFVPTDYVEQERLADWPGMEPWLTPSQEENLRIMSWDDVRTLAAAGWEIGSHTRSHRRLRGLGSSELDRELRGSRLTCEERIQAPCRSIAYPYGSPGVDLDAAAAQAAAAAGYTAGATVPRRLAPAEALLWPRVSIGAADSLMTFKAKVSPQVRRVRAFRAWPMVDAPRRIVRDRALARSDAQRIRSVDGIRSLTEALQEQVQAQVPREHNGTADFPQAPQPGASTEAR
ncbi:MAG: polysaccharide deacetylase family protein [Gaiellaceae bacterium]